LVVKSWDLGSLGIDRPCKAYSLVPSVKYCVIAREEVQSENPLTRPSTAFHQLQLTDSRLNERNVCRRWQCVRYVFDLKFDVFELGMLLFCALRCIETLPCLLELNPRYQDLHKLSKTLQLVRRQQGVRRPCVDNHGIRSNARDLQAAVGDLVEGQRPVVSGG